MLQRSRGLCIREQRWPREKHGALLGADSTGPRPSTQRAAMHARRPNDHTRCLPTSLHLSPDTLSLLGNGTALPCPALPSERGPEQKIHTLQPRCSQDAANPDTFLEARVSPAPLHITQPEQGRIDERGSTNSHCRALQMLLPAVTNANHGAAPSPRSTIHMYSRGHYGNWKCGETVRE